MSVSLRWKAEPLAEFEALRKSPSRARLFERVQELIRILEENPRDHRVRRQQYKGTEGWIWCLTAAAGAEEWTLVWGYTEGVPEVRLLEPTRRRL